MLQRYPDWPERLAQFIARARGRKFYLGTHDCCFFAADCVEAITGTDPAHDLRGGSAKTILKHYGGVAALAEAKTTEHNMPVISPRAARRADICLLDAGHGETLGVCVGAHIACPGRDGLVFYPLSTAQRAWQVG